MEPKETGPALQPEMIETEAQNLDTLTDEEIAERSAAVITRMNGLLYGGPNGTLDKKLLPERHEGFGTSDSLMGTKTFDATPWIDVSDTTGGVLQTKLLYWRDRLFFRGEFNDRFMQATVDRTPFPIILLRQRSSAGDAAMSPVIELLRVDTRKQDDPKLLIKSDEMSTDRLMWNHIDLTLDKIEKWRHEPDLLRSWNLATMSDYFSENFQKCIEWAGTTNRQEVFDKMKSSTTSWFTHQYAEWELGVLQEAARLDDPRHEVMGTLAIISAEMNGGFDDQEFVAESLQDLTRIELLAEENGLDDLLFHIRDKIDRLKDISNVDL